MTLNLRPTLTPEQHADMQAVMAAVLAAAKEKIGRREALTDHEAAVMEAAERSQRWTFPPWMASPSLQPTLQDPGG